MVIEKRDDDFNFNEDSDAFFAMLVQFVKVKEGSPHNHSYQWKTVDLLYVRAALDEMSQDKRNDFCNLLKDYQITKVLSIPPQGSS